MSDLIERQAAISLAGDLQILGDEYHMYNQAINNYCAGIIGLPSAQPDKEKISNALYHIYLNTSPHTSADGVVAIKYHIAEIWREIYGEEGPRWMT